MSPITQKIYSEAMHMTPIDRAELIELLLASFERSDHQELNLAWGKEAKSRLEAYTKGELPAQDSQAVFDEINKPTL